VIPRPPDIVIEGDSPARVMARTPELLGISLRRVVWRFGFQPGRALALTTGLWSPLATWALTGHVGTVIRLYRGAWADQPPAAFMFVLSAELEHDRSDFGGLHPRPPGVPAATAGEA
jgi:hypothetical protein